MRIAEAIDAAIREREEQAKVIERLKNPWLPIESAPKDGTHLLLHFDGIGPIRGRWDNDRFAKRPRPYWTCDAERWMGKIDIRSKQPNLWMPLPPPPNEVGEKNGR